MTQKEIIEQIKFAFKQLKLFPKENPDIKIQMEKPADKNLKSL